MESVQMDTSGSGKKPTTAMSRNANKSMRRRPAGGRRNTNAMSGSGGRLRIRGSSDTSGISAK
jgi:hypothetical protein